MAGCANDVEKARAIFRWITVKNLNSLMFEDVSGGDTPLGKQCLCITRVVSEIYSLSMWSNCTNSIREKNQTP